ncbi:MAG: asparagine synthase (glutamine-hydrolyzing) [Ginsengibacter sp.]
MCRISGIISPDHPTTALAEMVGKMCQLMKHGGPDDEGIYMDEEVQLVLGHRRLSLIDLTENGHQPMSYANGRFAITFNGEIYNYAELRSILVREGHKFRTSSDTEVILGAFAEWGTDSFDKLNGMFAFALWDKLEKEIYLVRDPSGIKPLYYGITAEGLAFSSEIRGFEPVPWLAQKNDEWPVFLLAYGHLPEPVTVLKKVKPLPKGSFLCFNANTFEHEIHSFKKYYFSDTISDRSTAVTEIRKSLQESVNRHLVADAPIGVFLSGGVDSGIVSLLAGSQKKSHLNTLSLDFPEPEFSEKKYQDMILNKLDARGSQHLLRAEEFQEYLPSILKAMDQPSCDGINTWFISKYARENGLKAVLSGIGGDELFGGYPSFSRMHKVDLLGKLPKSLLRSGKHTGRKAFKRLSYLSIEGATGEYLFLRGQFIPAEIARQLDMDEREVWEILSENPAKETRPKLDDFNEASWIELNLFMQNQLLRDVDVMGMAHGVEIRVPFLDKDFVDLTMKIRSKLKEEGALPKQLLIDSFKDILPQAIWDRPKMGFGFPFQKWLGDSEFARSLISPGGNIYNKFIAGNMHWSQFFSLMLVRYRGIPAANQYKEYRDLSVHYPAASNGHAYPAKGKKVMLLTLRTFSLTGGIEKVSRLAGKALHDLCETSGHQLTVYSMYDSPADIDEKYFPKDNFKGFDIKRLRFAGKALFAGVENDVIILSHLNLLPVGYLIKFFSPDTKLVLIAHGIEAWKTFRGWKREMLFQCDRILSVSQYTKDVLIERNHFPAEKIQVLNNCLDPYLEKPLHGEKNSSLLNKYGLREGDVVLLTLTRLASSERYKGYDIVIESLKELRKTNTSLKYLIIGKYDAKEKQRLDQLIRKAGVETQVIFTGFVPDEELAEHFNLADIYIMPSEKEGFGIVFIEAMYYNKPVIAGNKDGSVDALLNGELGFLVNPGSKEEVSGAIESIISNKTKYLPDNQLLMKHFSFPVYREKWAEVLEGL